MTFRALLIGLLISTGIGLVLPVTEFLIQGTRLGLSSATPAAFFLLFVLVGVIQPILKTIRPGWALTRSELLVVFAMMMVATVIPTRGFGGPLFGMSTGATYYADEGNQWDKNVRPHLSSSIVVTDKEAVRQMYEGQDAGAEFNWQVWMQSLGWWWLFGLAMTVMVVSVMLLFRRAWIDDERISFPVAQVAQALVEEGPDGSRIIGLFREPAFWFGFFIPMIFGSLNPLHNYFPDSFDRFHLSWGISHRIPFADSFNIRINFLMVGFAFFIESRLAFSLWFFYLVSQPLQWIYGHFFFDHREGMGYWTSTGPHGTIQAHQQMGAMLVLVAGMIWASRKRLLDEKILLIVFFVSGCAVCMMVGATGVPLWITPLVVGSALVIWLSLTRLMAQAGTATIVPAIIPLGFVFSTVGTPNLGAAGLVGLGLTFIWAGDLLTYLMGPAGNSVYLQHKEKVTPARTATALIVAVMVSLAACMVMTLYLTHKYGALNLHPQYFNTFSQYPWKFAAKNLNRAVGPPMTGYVWTAVGAGIMLVLTWIHRAIYWWPLHPLGFLAQGSWIMRSLWFSFFLSWLIKILVLRYGGGAAFKKAKVFFIGLIVGLLVAGGMWLVIDSITGTHGNRVYIY